MSHLTYSSYEGYGTWSLENSHYSQAVRVGDLVHISGQGEGGWDVQTRAIVPGLEAELEQAFANVALTLRDAAVSRAWAAVYAVRLYVAADVDRDAAFALAIAALRRWCPDHRPILTGVVVARLAFDMHFEIEVSAQQPLP